MTAAAAEPGAALAPRGPEQGRTQSRDTATAAVEEATASAVAAPASAPSPVTPEQAPSTTQEEPPAAASSVREDTADADDEAGGMPSGAGSAEAEAVLPSSGDHTAESERIRPPSGGPRKPLLAAAAIVGAILIAVPLLLFGHDDKPQHVVRTDATGGGTVLTGEPSGLPAGGTSESPTASPSPKKSGPSKKPAAHGAAASTPTSSHHGKAATTAKATTAAKASTTTSHGSGSSAAPAPVSHALVVQASGKCLSRGDGTEGTQLFQATCDGSADQQWQIRSDGTIRSSGKCMTVAGGATDDRTEIQLSGCAGIAAQRFGLDGTKLLAAASQKCVDIFGGATGTGAVLWECNGRDNQIWTLR
ncbi:RICIN domain-containing protein [Streptomyces sp. STR69]|uniref:RICIN domain-containing protein n=1 Tax=Streptomyces sp. STR69 TaxID=1796942 RepID=UPI0021C78D29|nr:RICIN domain-containing protein [Streptomyces sp. STR69]